MLLTQFPDINWLREQAKTSFSNQKGVNNKPLANQGWPSVVLNTKSLAAERTDIIAPFSLFLNLSGKSKVRSDRKEIELTDDNFCLVNKGHAYDLIIPEHATTFNIHFGDKLFSEVVSTFQDKANRFLDPPSIDFSEPNAEFNIKSIWKDEGLKRLLNQLQYYYQHSKTNNFDDHNEYELLSEILSKLVAQQSESYSRPKLVSISKASTRIELISRLTKSVDYIHAHYHQHVSLDQLSAVACLSKYHYLRLFKEVFKCTPQQMIAKCRFEKAVSLLRTKTQTIADISLELGFSEHAAFSRFFVKHQGISPQTYRKQN